MVDTYVEIRSYFNPFALGKDTLAPSARPLQRQKALPIALFTLMLCTLAFAVVVLTLRDFGFVDALVGHLIPLTAWPAHVLFAGLPLVIEPSYHPYSLALGWQEIGLLAGTFLSIFLLYLIALRCLPRRISLRYLLLTTAAIGALLTLTPIISSADVFSYIAYARYGVFYHQNMLTVTPSMFPNDTIAGLVQWKNQPSAYGPTWAFLSYVLQWVMGLFRTQNIVSMVLALRLLALAAHLLSVGFVWSIIGHLQRHYGLVSRKKQQLATLAFAWNPLLLFEACVNAHNDSVLLMLVLLAILVLARRERPITQDYLLAAFVMAVACCLKINVILLAVAFLLFLWVQRPRPIRTLVAASVLYVVTIALLYAPFWSDGAILQVFNVNPGMVRAVNTPADFLGHVYNGLIALLGAPVPLAINSPAERALHSVFTVLFAAVCIIYGLRTLYQTRLIHTLPRLIQWMATIWLLYCVLTPWFWPWYMFVFFGLYALIEGISNDKRTSYGLLQSPLVPRLLTLTLLGLNCFANVPMMNTMIPGIPGFQWAFLRGLWAWLPLLFYCWQLRPSLHILHLSARRWQVRAIPVLLEQPEESRSTVTV